MNASDDVTATLGDLGGFAALTVTTPSDQARPWPEVLGATTLQRRFAAVRTALAAGADVPVEDVDPKVAVSAVQVGLASRLWAVSLACAVLCRWVPELSASTVLASPAHGGPVPLGARAPLVGHRAWSPEEAATLLGRHVLDAGLADLDDACAVAGRTAPRVLLSNTASSLVGAARVLRGQRPACADSADQVVRLLLAHPRLRAAGTWRSDRSFGRRGCCLFYRLPGHGLCPDCVLVDQAG